MLWQYWIFFLSLLRFLLWCPGRSRIIRSWRQLAKGLIIFTGLNGNFIDRRAFRTFNKIARSKAKSNFLLTIPTNNNTIKRKALIHILTSTTYENLTISRNQLNNCAKITCSLPIITKPLHHRQTWSYFLLWLFLVRYIV